MMGYSEKLSARIDEIGSNLCVGIDPRPDLIDGDFETFVRDLVDQTIPYAACYKPKRGIFRGPRF